MINRNPLNNLKKVFSIVLFLFVAFFRREPPSLPPGRFHLQRFSLRQVFSLMQILTQYFIRKMLLPLIFRRRSRR